MKIKDLIIRILLQSNYTEEEIVNLLNEYEQKTISESNIFTTRILKNLLKNNVVSIKNLLDLSVKEAAENSLLCKNSIRNCIKRMIIELTKESIFLKEKIIIESKIEQIHNNLTTLIKEIKQNKQLKKFLKEEIIYIKLNNINQKPWKYSKLNLTEKEINVLRQYLVENIELENIYKNSNIYELGIMLIKIHNNVSYYIEKLKYKEILDKYYYELETIEIKARYIRALKRNNITCVSDIIEYSEGELINLQCISISTLKKIFEKLKEKNIVFLNHKEKILENLKLENAGIIINKTKQKILI